MKISTDFKQTLPDIRLRSLETGTFFLLCPYEKWNRGTDRIYMAIKRETNLGPCKLLALELDADTEGWKVTDFLETTRVYPVEVHMEFERPTP